MTAAQQLPGDAQSAVGASLLAKTVDQPAYSVNGTPHSRAGSLPQDGLTGNRVSTRFALLPLDRQRYALTTADAQGGQAFFGVALEHFVKQGHQDPAT